MMASVSDRTEMRDRAVDARVEIGVAEGKVGRAPVTGLADVGAAQLIALEVELPGVAIAAPAVERPDAELSLRPS